MTHSWNRIDPDLIPGNIADWVEIFGVLGTLTSGGAISPTNNMLSSEAILLNNWLNNTFDYQNTWNNQNIRAETPTHYLGIYANSLRESWTHQVPASYVISIDKSTWFISYPWLNAVNPTSSNDRWSSWTVVWSMTIDVYVNAGNVQVVYFARTLWNFSWTIRWTWYKIYIYTYQLDWTFVSGWTLQTQITEPNWIPNQFIPELRPVYQANHWFTEANRISNSEFLTIWSDTYELKSYRIINNSAWSIAWYPYIITS